MLWKTSEKTVDYQALSLESAGDNSGTIVDEKRLRLSGLEPLLIPEERLQFIHNNLWKEKMSAFPR